MKRASLVVLQRTTLAAALGMAAFLTGCSNSFFQAQNNNPGGTGSTTFAYVTNQSASATTGGTLTEYSLTAGVLAQLSGSPITLPANPYSVVVAPNDLYVFVGTGAGIFLYTINSDGTLTEGNANNVAYINATNSALLPESMVVDATDSWLLIAYQNSTILDAVQITPATGIPTGNVFSINSKFGTANPRLALAPANTEVFVTMGTGGTEALAFTPTATAAPTGPWPTTGTVVPPGVDANKLGTSATAVAVDPTSALVYITEASTNPTTATAGILRVFKIATLGAEVADYPTGVNPSAVLPDFSSAYVYVTNASDNDITGYTLDTTSSTLTPLTSTIPTGNSPVALVEDSTKTYIMDVGSLNNPDLWLYTFDSTSPGALDVGTTTSTATTNPSLANAIAATH